MNCLQCGAKLEKTDIFCIKCETPVLTDDDIILMPNAETTKFVNEAQYIDPKPHSNEILYTAELKSATAKFDAQYNTVDNLIIEKARDPGLSDENGDTKFYDLQSGGFDKKRNNRKAVIITSAVAFVLAAGFGLFLFLSSSGTKPDDPDAASPVSGSAENDNAVTVPPAAGRDISDSAPAPDVTEIILLSNGRVQTEFHTKVGASVLLQAKLGPEGADADVLWSSSDPEVLDVRSSVSNGSEAFIVGVAAGVADIIVSAGGVEFYYIVFVDNMPFHVQLENAVADEGTSVWLTLFWSGSAAAGRETGFEREAGSSVWNMEDASGRVEVVPVFGSENDAFIFELTGIPGVYFLFGDGSGYIRYPDGTENEDFEWSFMTTLIEPEG